MKCFLIILSFLTGLIIVVFTAGTTLRRQHTATASATFSSLPETVCFQSA